MALTLMCITNDERFAKVYEQSGVDWIFIDLEIHGKRERQGNLSSVISEHDLYDIPKVKQVLTKAKLLVRINPIHEESKNEIDAVINLGADIVMLPYFKSSDEVKEFVSFVQGRVPTCLLLETAEAVENIDTILAVDGIDYIHIGLNDLHLSYGMKFMFEPLANGLVENIVTKISKKNIPYGFGGIAQLGSGMLPAEYILAEHYRLQSSMVILSRTFCNVEVVKDLEEIRKIFTSGINNIRMYEKQLASMPSTFFLESKASLMEKVSNIIHSKTS